MKPSRLFFLTLFPALAAALLLWPAAAPALADAPYRSPKLSAAEPGNNCLGCHTADDARLATATAWAGSIDRQFAAACSAAGQVQEQVYYTERLLLAIGRTRAGLPGTVDAAKTDARLAAARQTYSRLLDTPVAGLEAVTAEAAALRYTLGKDYRWLNQARIQGKQQEVLLWAGLITLGLVISLGWGWRNIARFTGAAHPAARFRFSFKAALFVGLLFGLFALPIFRTPTQETAVVSAEEQARQTALDTANRAAATADRAMGRAWMLARVGAAWAQTNPTQAEAALEAALTAARDVQLNSPVLWGEAQAAQEGAIGSEAAQEKAGLMTARLNAANSRAWALRQIAAEWLTVDPTRAEAILQEALAAAAGRSGLYRDLDMRAIAVTWANVNPQQAVAVAERVYTPALKAWALRDIAQKTGDAALYLAAAEAARGVADPVDRAAALRNVAVASGNAVLVAEALTALDGVTGVTLAYALSDLAAASGDAAIAARIEAAYPDAQAAALYRLGQFEAAWAAAAAIADPFDQARAQAAISAAWGNAEAALSITDPTLRDIALRDIAVAKNDPALAQGIQSLYYRVQALTALGQYPAAFEAAPDLADTYPLRDLAVAWAKTDPAAALQVVDLLDREADKAEAMRAVAVASGDDAAFERALTLALAARVRGDALAPAEAALNLARSFNPADPAKAEAAFTLAYDTAGRISTRYK
jgi:hypothetical protein